MSNCVCSSLYACVSFFFSSSVRVGSSSPRLVAKTSYESKWVTGANGKLIEQKIPKKKLFKVINKKTSMPDPQDPAKSIIVEVPTEVAYQPNRKVNGRVAKLKERYQALKKREHELKAQYASAHSKKVDFPVLEDGAPARPDPQMVKMAEELYGELEATQFPKAVNIRQDDLNRARQFAKDAGANRQQIWDFFDEMKQKMLVPSHGWGMTM